MTDKFIAITAFLSEADAADLAYLTFDNLCRRHGADARRMDWLFYETFGISGDEILSQFADSRRKF